MNPLTEAELRASFVNCTRGERTRINLPGPLGAVDFGTLDFLGWRDPKAPERGYLVVEAGDRWVGIVLRAATKMAKSVTRSTMCLLCQTLHDSSGVTLFTAPLAGPAGRVGNSVGTYICTDLQCSHYLRGLRRSTAMIRMPETIDLPGRVDRLRRHLDAFVDKVLAPDLT